MPFTIFALCNLRDPYKLKSNYLFCQNIATCTTISFLVGLHVSVSSQIILRLTFICKSYYQCTVYIMESHVFYTMCVKTIINVFKLKIM